MKPGSTARFVLALAAAAAIVQVGLGPALALGARGGMAGIVVTLVAGGFAVALLFTVICDGPRSVARVLRRG